MASDFKKVDDTVHKFLPGKLGDWVSDKVGNKVNNIVQNKVNDLGGQVTDLIDSFIKQFTCGKHEYGDFEILKNPTCTEKRQKGKICKKCGKITEKTDIDAAGHAPVTDPAVAPTETTEEVTAPVEAEGDVMSHADYMAAELDSPVCIETYVQAHQSWWDNKLTVYAQSEDGAYFIYNMECSEEDAAKLVPGTKIRVNGYKTEWSGEVEIAEGATFEILEGSYIAEPQDITGGLGAQNLIDWQNAKISVSGLTVVAANDEGAAFLYNWDGSGAAGNNNDLYFNVSDGTSAMVTLEKSLTEVKKQGEIEGLCVDPKTDEMLVLYNRGARIILGMGKGFYPGYDHEIHEVYRYRMTELKLK